MENTGRRAGATRAGTTRYSERFLSSHPSAAPGHFRQADDGLLLSSIGLGTYLGEPDDRTDERYRESIWLALSLGCNVIDTAINYRFQRSERAIGAALAEVIREGVVARDEVFLSTKGGLLSFEPGWSGEADRWVNETFVVPGIASADDFAHGHCMSPSYLRHQIAQSRKNLGVDCIDLYYLHNPESQLPYVTPSEFMRRIRLAFEELEAAVSRGEIAGYGTATWNAYRQPLMSHNHLSLGTVLESARAVGGVDHHFCAVQLPLNMLLAEALLEPTQLHKGEMCTLLEVSLDLGISVYASASIMQGRLAAGLPLGLRDKFPGCAIDAQRALQFARSTPGLTSALVGMSSPEHVRQNMALAYIPPLDVASFAALFD